MQQRCILCGRIYIATVRNIRPGDPVRCELHVWKELEQGQVFTVEEARRAGEERVKSLSQDEIYQEGQIAFSELARWQRWLDDPDVSGDLRQHALDVIAAKRAYLSAFD